MTKESRRKALKKISLSALGIPLASQSILGNSEETSRETLVQPPFGNQAFDKPVTAITLGAGSRGNVYGDYGYQFPNELDIIGVAEPIAIRNERYATKHKIENKNRFKTWEDVFTKPKFADAVIITTPDSLHYGPCMKALEMGYDVLLEKPIAPTEKECRDILAMAKRTGRIVAVCHVLRYAPYFIKLKEMIQTEMIGELISIQHFEPIEHIHMSHSFVRGNWHNSKETTPIILAKSCHDLDILRWMVGKPSKSISAFGDLKWFRKENAPQGSTARCTDGCAVESKCPYSALKIYHQNRERTYVFDMPDDKSKHGDFILEQLKTTNYGRCVYRMDNDQPDHYITNIQFDENVTASFSMEAFTSYHGRRTRVMGSMGDIVGDMETFTFTDFLTRKSTTWDVKVNDVKDYEASGHGGGDWALASDWVKAVKAQDANLLTSTIDASIESHLMAFAAEESRLGKRIVDITL